MNSADKSTAPQMDKGRFTLRDPIWQFVSVVCAVLSVVVTLYATYDVYSKGKTVQDLEVAILYFSPLAALDSTRGHNLQILYNGQTARSASLIAVHIHNIGNQPIRPQDFEAPIVLKLPASARVVGRYVKNGDPPSLKPAITQVASGILKLEPLLLNANDSFVVELTVLDFERFDATHVTAEGRIAGIRDIAVSVASPKTWVDGLRKAYNTEAMIVIPIATVSLFLLLMVWRKPWDALEQLFGHRPESRWGKFSLNITIATFVATTLEDVVEGIIQVIRVLRP